MSFLLMFLMSLQQDKGVFSVTGVGVLKDKEVVIDNIAFEYSCSALTAPTNGNTIAFSGTFDGKKLNISNWQAHKSISKRIPHLDFVADGAIIDTSFQAGGTRIELNFIPPEFMDKQIRATGFLVTGGDSVRYFITRMEIKK